ncbi:type II toxin-antitoxin system PemK/MazF family toxin [Agathobacter rectalis]|uniref:Type II toxin-antitoxin system PemK/MazF family toxin n=1 Tax=Agathobacter rectalis TaxID=39491 RepID=A0A3E4Y2D2_9FIRM|nr:type II toxin-antitoxin system PemK/MazF family toxin [Agathobacter rectalis]RGK40630.1 type II toxin-antitoxin system PemK/MazF family toxin [Agathobacter rectalis]RGM67115.1 type II toxin-antitoxin system PemK/MazF family toxin [Agathobacter rectalis]RGU19632.1 type II toxin-antitoxin system PemK/MazF family toxin [Agathobacter rectalis]RHC36336.1 type II toxin-antitoxin system PemK/MazF family toxin [Agathobacter rectalis]
MKIKRNMIVWAELKNGLKHIQAGRRPCIVISCDKANGKSPVYTVILGTTKMRKDYIPVHFNIEPSEIKGFLRHTTMFLPEQLVTINEEQIIQIAGMIVSTDAIKKVDAMLVRQLQIGEYDG